MKKIFIILGFILYVSPLFSQQQIIFSGRVFNNYSMEKVEAATVVVYEAKKKGRVDKNAFAQCCQTVNLGYFIGKMRFGYGNPSIKIEVINQ